MSRVASSINKIDRLLYEIESTKNIGYAISRSGDYVKIEDPNGYTETRLIHEDEYVTVCITDTKGKRHEKTEVLDVDMEVELVAGKLVYKVEGQPKEVRLINPKDRITIKAGKKWSYRIPVDGKRCIFKMTKNPKDG